MSIESYMDELTDPSKKVTAAGLAQLSSLASTELDELASRWLEIPSERRRDIVNLLSGMAEENPEYDFTLVLCHALHDQESMVREPAVAGLWESDDRRMIPRLIQVLEHDPEDAVRASAASVLGHFAVLADTGHLVKRDCDRLFQALMGALEDDDEPILVRRRALEAIASFRVPGMHAWVQWAYDHADAELRRSSLFAMGKTSDETWLPIAYDELQSDDPAMRYEAVNAIRDLGESDSLVRVARMITDTDPQVALAAVQAVGAIGGTAARKLLEGLSEGADDQVIREAAEEALGVLDAESSDFSKAPLGLPGLEDDALDGLPDDVLDGLPDGFEGDAEDGEW
jgi:HEAT repeat protein